MSLKNQIPLIGIIGEPNSGKSTLLNHLTGVKAITAMEAHTTRDLNYGEDYWEGIFMRFVDTGGLVPDTKERIAKEVQLKSWSAIAQSDLLIWLIDRKQNPDTIPEKIIQRIWKTGKPFIIAINKVDDPNLDNNIADYAFLGGVGFVNISCNTGYGFNDLMELVLENLVKLGYEQNFDGEFDFNNKKERRKSKNKLKKVEKAKEGDYYIVRNDSGKFESVNKNIFDGKEGVKKDEDEVKNIVLDLGGVLLELRYNQMDKYLQENFDLTPNKDYHPEIIFENANKNGDKFEDIKFWEKLVDDLNLLDKLK
jgi:small GTP-binding protein